MQAKRGRGVSKGCSWTSNATPFCLPEPRSAQNSKPHVPNLMRLTLSVSQRDPVKMVDISSKRDNPKLFLPGQFLAQVMECRGRAAHQNVKSPYPAQNPSWPSQARGKLHMALGDPWPTKYEACRPRAPKQLGAARAKDPRDQGNDFTSHMQTPRKCNLEIHSPGSSW